MNAQHPRVPSSDREESEFAPSPTGFPGGSAGEESSCNAGNPGSMLGWEDPLQKEKATHSSILACDSMNCIVHGVAKS